jgi:hypothetical protein
MQEARLVGFCLMLLMCAAGCQRGPVPLIPVSGKVTYKGFALPSGTIVFAPDASRGESGPIAHGQLNADGIYQLSTGEALGAAPGWYRVTVTSQTSVGKPLPGERFSFPQSLIPERYHDPELSRLACEVKAGRANTIDLNLE